MENELLLGPGMFVEYSVGQETLYYGRIMMEPVAGRVHLQKYYTSRQTVLEGLGSPNELFSSHLCKVIRCSLIIRTVQVSGPFDVATPEQPPVHFKYRYRYSPKDGSFVEDNHLYGRLGGDTCEACKAACSSIKKNEFHWTGSLLGKVKEFVTMGGVSLETGTFVVTTKDVAQYPWKKKFCPDQVSQPSSINDTRFPELWRVSKMDCSSVKTNFRTVCKIASVVLKNNPKRTCRKQSIDARDIQIEAVVYARPIELGAKLPCCYEVVKTNQVVHLTGRDLHAIVEVDHASAHRDLLGWIRRGVFSGRPRFHYTFEFDITSRVMQLSAPETRSNQVKHTSMPAVARLTSLELYAGCGGLSFGLEAAGLTECKWAVEQDPRAAKVFAKNFPRCKVFTQDVVKWFSNLKDNPTDSSLPQPRKVDIITGGPPCQGFSRLNRHKSSTSSVKKRQSSEDFFAVALYLEPRFIIFENVSTFTMMEKGANMQAALARLVNAGYQARFTVMRAAAHGVPQNRQRTIIVAARIGEKLPNFPGEEYFLRGGVPSFKLGACVLKNHIQGPVLYSQQNVIAAIGDLVTIPCWSGHKRTAHYPDCKSVLQDKLRQGSKDVTRHSQIHPLSELNERRIKFIPQGGDWRYIPNEAIFGEKGQLLAGVLDYQGSGSNKRVCPCTSLNKCVRVSKQVTSIPWCLAHTASNNGNWKGAFGRLQAEGLFPTLITNPGPLKSNGRIVHPCQDRFISLREAARAQTFPDSFHFDRDVAVAMKQIGNAVPPLLSEALGRAFMCRE